MSRILDTSALLAAFWGEPGATRVADVLPRARMSAVNVAEFVTKLVERSFGPTEVDRALQRLPIEIVAFDRVQARAAGLLRERTMHLGLSLGDRACLALALAEGLPVLTADRAWARLDVGVRVELIR